MTDQRFGKSRRLKTGREFSVVIHHGSYAADHVLVVHARESEHPDSPRLGVTIPRRTGVAVIRNRWKRLIRESFRTQRGELPVHYDFVVRPKLGARLKASTVRSSLPRLARNAVARLKRR